MKVQHISKIGSIREILSPTLLRCKSGECGSCPEGTGKMLWVSGNLDGTIESVRLNFQYNFFNKSTESTSTIINTLASRIDSYGDRFTYENPPNKAWAIANGIAEGAYPLSPSLMKGTDIIRNINYSVTSYGGWLFFRQPNPAIGNVHDALCFEYNHERRLITFRSF